MLATLHKKQQLSSSCCRSSLGRLLKLASSSSSHAAHFLLSGEGLHTRLVNHTGCQLVLRSKFRDVWEGTPFTLPPGESVLLHCTPDEPYRRWAAFVVPTGPSAPLSSAMKSPPPPPPLMIGQHILAANREIAVVRTPPLKDISTSLSPRL